MYHSLQDSKRPGSSALLEKLDMTMHIQTTIYYKQKVEKIYFKKRKQPDPNFENLLTVRAEA
jgi:hypothetical protein